MDEPVSKKPSAEEDGEKEEEEEDGDEPLRGFLDEVNCPEPGIIDRKMIESAYLEEGQKGEARRLHQLEPVVYERIRTMRLEFKNILRIDHLWMMPNLTTLCLNCNKIEVIEHLTMLTALKDLNLSFNYITRIENLETLVNLEKLSLFSNRIQKIENLQTLEKLVILSIGNNLINTVEGIERLRFVSSLRVLNLEGNPIAKMPDFPLSLYVTAILPQLNYYEYVFIKAETRAEAQKRFYRELREIEDKQEREIQGLATEEREMAEAERLASSFVEHLDGHQLYESLWRDDNNGRILMLVGTPAQELTEEYTKDVHELTQQIYRLGLERFGERDAEIRDFNANLYEGQEELQSQGQKQIEEFLQYKEQTFDEMRLKWRDLDQRDDDLEEVSAQLDALTGQFEDALNEMWQSLMAQELHLHEAVEDSTLNFKRKITQLMASFVEQAQVIFQQLRDVCGHFADNMTEIVSQYLASKLLRNDLNAIPEELRKCVADRDALRQLVEAMRSSHASRVYEREDRMANRSREFIDDMIKKLKNKEVDRHRAKVLEINSFMEMMTEALANLPREINQSKKESLSD
ncbi:dynein regulatory complex subunit 3 [Drosophila serrata]|uniref:dynein regulatory complex subunit 3 n=1 Tax=Drosophila serrata TaxID=7274 RepID=UPI000A1D009F|nr:dynein regulatory complex subunit 3 [Drosophila serrata]XP_020807054.1 dynein regulatory complex subunit 3 [Drosophila serrata]XP_020807055.1 dynein regulatory complex subunit 3 [Drosophila serrata]